MSKRFGRKDGLRSAMTLAGITWFIVAWLTNHAAAGEDMCKGLKPFNNLDELLYQFYINLDSDCLFTMPLEGLEKTWGIRIFSWNYLKENSAYYSVDDRFYFENKPFKAEKDAFFLTHFSEKNTVEIVICITNEYREKYATLFPDGNYPKLIPAPVKKIFLKSPPPPQHRSIKPTLPKKPAQAGVYSRMESHIFYWLNSDQTHIILLDGDYGVTQIIVRNRVSDFLRATSD